MNDIPITWNSFTEVNPDNDNLHSFTAYSYPEYRYKYSIEDSNSKKYCHLHIAITFDASKSYISKQFLQSSSATDKASLLNHEKGHYVICIIEAKKMISSLEILPSIEYNMKMYLDSVSRITNSAIKTLNTTYDAATNHGRNVVEQQKWETALLAELNELYKNEEKLNMEEDVYIPLPHSLSKLNDPISYKYPDSPAVAFEDNFDDDRNHWLAEVDAGVSQQGIDYSIKDGQFKIANYKKDGGWIYTIYPQIDYSRDYEIEISFKIEGYKNKFANTILFGWGRDSISRNAGTQVEFNSMGGFEIHNCLTDGNKEWKNKHGFANIFYKDGYNIFSLRKSGNTYYVFINGKFEKSLPANQLKGNAIYLGADKLSIISYDYLKIHYLTGK